MKKIFVLFCLFNSFCVLYGQNEEDSLFLAQKRRFDYFFFEGLRERLSGNYKQAVSYYLICQSINDKSPVILYEYANILFSLKDYESAKNQMERACKLDPENTTYLNFLCEIYNNLNDFDSSISVYEHLLKDAPGNTDYIYYLYVLNRYKEDYKTALYYLEMLEKKVPFNDLLILYKSEIYGLLNKPKQALKCLTDLHKSFPDNPKYMAYIGTYYIHDKNISKATEWFEKAVATDQTASIYNFDLGNIRLSQSDTLGFENYYLSAVSSRYVEYDSKIQRLMPLLADQNFLKNNYSSLKKILLQLIESEGNEPNSYFIYANFLTDINQKKEAIPYFKSAISLDENNEQIWHNLLLLLIDENQENEAYNYSAQAVKLFPDNAFFIFINSNYLLSDKKYGESLELLLRADSLTDNKNIKFKLILKNNIAQCYHELGDSLSSFKVYDEILLLDPYDLTALNNYSYFLSLIDKDLDKAERMSRKCIELEPLNSTFLDTYAWILFKERRYLEAKFIIERAVDNLQSDDSTVFEHYGDILFFNSDVNNAVNQWQKALLLNPNSENLKRKIEYRDYTK